MGTQRNRQKTELKIIEAAEHILETSGFAEFGINAIARSANIDKVLIYRYFKSVDGLMEQIISRTQFWPNPDSISKESHKQFLAETFQFLSNSRLRFLLTAHPLNKYLEAIVSERVEAENHHWNKHLQECLNNQHPEISIINCGLTLWAAAALQLPYPRMETFIKDEDAPWNSTKDTHTPQQIEEDLPTELL